MGGGHGRAGGGSEGLPQVGRGEEEADRRGHGEGPRGRGVGERGELEEGHDRDALDGDDGEGVAAEERERARREGRREAGADGGDQVGDAPEVGHAQEAEGGLVEEDAEGGVGPEGGPLRVPDAEAVEGDRPRPEEHPPVGAGQLRKSAHPGVADGHAGDKEELPREEVEAAGIDGIERSPVDRGRPLDRKPDGGADPQDPPAPAGFEGPDDGRQQQDKPAVHRQEVEKARLVEEREPEADRFKRVLKKELRNVGRAVAERVLGRLDEHEGRQEGSDVPAVDAPRAVRGCLPQALQAPGAVFARVHPSRQEAREEDEALGGGEEPHGLVRHLADLRRQVVYRHEDEKEPPQAVKPQVARARQEFWLGLHSSIPDTVYHESFHIRAIFQFLHFDFCHFPNLLPRSRLPGSLSGAPGGRLLRHEGGGSLPLDGGYRFAGDGRVGGCRAGRDGRGAGEDARAGSDREAAEGPLELSPLRTAPEGGRAALLHPQFRAPEPIGHLRDRPSPGRPQGPHRPEHALG